MKNSIACLLSLLVLFMLSCHSENVLQNVELDINKGNNLAKERGLKEVKISLNANSNEICYFVKDNGDTITFIGNKFENGTAKDLYLMKYNSSGEQLNTRFDDKMRPTTLSYNNKVHIDFTWIDDTKALLKVYDAETNSVINTTWDVNGSTKSVYEDIGQTFPNNYKTRSGNVQMSIKNRSYENIAIDTKATPFEDLHAQSCLFTVTECGFPTDVDTWIHVYRRNPSQYLGMLEYYKKVSPGVFIYRIPTGAYPASATTQELCQNIDNYILSPLSVGLNWLAGFSSIAEVITLAAASTGFGLPPAGVLQLITAATLVGAASLDIFMAANGTQGLMSHFFPETYYNDYIVGDIFLYPVIFADYDFIRLDERRVTPETNDFTIKYDIDGDPTIDRFELNPAYPTSGYQYTATAAYHCVPIGSEIRMEIKGTDEYRQHVTSYATETSGIAEMVVPGAESGVKDLCWVTITPPEGKSITMTASLMFY